MGDQAGASVLGSEDYVPRSDISVGCGPGTKQMERDG